MQKISPFLWFDGNAEEAMNFYTAIFRNSRIVERMTGPDGKLFGGTMVLEDQELKVLNGGPMFKFTEAISLFVQCDSQEEVDRYWASLGEGGSYQQCGWLKDKFGLSWQIVPKLLGNYLKDKDPARAGRVMQAMMKMVKLDIGELQKAYDGA